jgi:DNA-binding NarL/FixJ family response regulator
LPYLQVNVTFDVTRATDIRRATSDVSDRMAITERVPELDASSADLDRAEHPGWLRQRACTAHRGVNLAQRPSFQNRHFRTEGADNLNDEHFTHSPAVTTVSDNGLDNGNLGATLRDPSAHLILMIIEAMGDPGLIRVVAVDDHELARLGISWLAGHGTGLVIAGTAGSARQALGIIERTQPSVVTIGTVLPDLDGLELAGMLRDRYPRLGLLMILPEPDAALVAAAAQRGLSGAVPLTASAATVTALIRAAANEPHSFRAPGEFLRAPDRPSPRLSPRERQVLALLVDGRTHAEIANALAISPATAKTHVSRLYGKLQARNRSQALLATAREGLLPLR